MSNTTGLIPDPNIWQTTGMIIPAVMTLICFICTAVSLTVSGFICLRDKEAQDESDNKVKHQKQQEFVSKALGLFYKTRTSNVFRIKEIVSDLNDERPVWIGQRRGMRTFYEKILGENVTEILSILEYYGIFLTESEKAKFSSNAEVFEIDCESLFYFELERFSKAQAIYGGNVLKYFQCIQQDGAAFPREFYPDIKPIFNIDIIYNIFTEMQIMTELFVLLTTGIDLEIISIHTIPPQFKHSQLGNEFAKIKDFLYNYYLRVFPRERSTASVMRLVPKLPITYEPMPQQEVETKEIIVEEEEIIEDEVYEIPKSPETERPGPSLVTAAADDNLSIYQETAIPPEPITLGPTYSSPSKKPSPVKSFPVKGKRFDKVKQRLKMVKVYKTLAERIRQRPYYQEEEAEEEEEEEDILPSESPARAPFPSVDVPTSSKQARKESIKSQLRPEPTKKTKKRIIKKRVPVVVPKEPKKSQEEMLDEMRLRYRAPLKRDGQARRRGRLNKQKIIEHNAFTYMVARVLAFLQEKGELSEEALKTEQFHSVDRNFIV